VPHENWLSLCRRILSDTGINISDQSLLKVIATGNGSARDILDSIVSIVLKVRQSNALVSKIKDSGLFV
jgi:DNA polymerase III gamma/tau subunit